MLWSIPPHLHNGIVNTSQILMDTCVQVLAEQARRLGITIEAENALENSAARAAVSKKKKDPGYSLEISSIHRRVKEMMKSRATAPEAEASASRSALHQPLQDSETALPSGWEARTDESSGVLCCHTSQMLKQPARSTTICMKLAWSCYFYLATCVQHMY